MILDFAEILLLFFTSCIKKRINVVFFNIYKVLIHHLRKENTYLENVAGLEPAPPGNRAGVRAGSK